MKKNQLVILPLAFGLLLSKIGYSQCGVSYSLSSANNMFGIIDNNMNPVVVDKNLNTVLFLHRHNTSTFGGNSGNLRYDISTNNGNTWTTNIGVLNPISTFPARYPNAVIYNPSGNTNFNNAHIGYMAATTNTSSGWWNGVVTGGQQLNGSGNYEAYNQPASPSYLIARSMIKGAPGVFWAIDRTSANGASFTGGIIVYKGTWNSSTNSISWAINTTLNPGLSTTWTSYPAIGNINIAFDPTGNTGWIGFMADLNTVNNGLYSPVFYKTINGGASWSGPVHVNLANLNCLSSNIAQGYQGAAHFESDLAVDINGNPHLIAVFGSGNPFNINPYFISTLNWHHALDITNTGGNWFSYDISNVLSGPASFGSGVTQNYSPDVTRTSDGTKVFFSWTDNTTYSLGDANFQPNLFAKGLDVQTLKWTPTKDFSSCNSATNGKILFPHVAAEVLEPSSGNYKLAPVYGEFIVAGDPNQPANFRFLDNCLFSATEFTVANGTLNVNIIQGSSALICPGSTLNLQINGTYSQINWSNGNQTNINPINSPGQYIVTASSGCASNSDTIVVKSLTLSVLSSSSTICQNAYAYLTVNTNANSYTWTPGPSSNSLIAVSPTATTIFTLTASGDGCNLSSNLTISVNPVPTIVAISNHQKVCAGEEIIIQATGASIYVWSTGATTSSMSAFPNTTTVYSLTGLNTLGCATIYTITQLVDACTGISFTKKEDFNFTVYPNPNQGHFIIKAQTPVDLILYNNLGQICATLKLNENNNYEANALQLPAGIYYVSDRTNTALRQKLIVTN